MHEFQTKQKTAVNQMYKLNAYLHWLTFSFVDPFPIDRSISIIKLNL